MAKPSNRELHALRNLIAETDLILSTTTLPEGRATRCRELLGAALALTEDFINQASLTPGAVLGRKGGSVTAQRHGSEHFRQMAASRKTRAGGRPKSE